MPGENPFGKRTGGQPVAEEFQAIRSEKAGTIRRQLENEEESSGEDHNKEGLPHGAVLSGQTEQTTQQKPEIGGRQKPNAH